MLIFHIIISKNLKNSLRSELWKMIGYERWALILPDDMAVAVPFFMWMIENFMGELALEKSEGG